MPSNDPQPDAMAVQPPAQETSEKQEALLPDDAPAAGTPGTGDPGDSRYQILKALSGDMHIARDRLLDRSVHVRLADPAHADDLEREARFVARLEHTGVMAVHDFVRVGDGAMMVLHNPEGVSLATAISESRNGAPRNELATTASIVQILMRVCDALAAAHARGVLHRNLTPEAIILGWHGQIQVGKWHEAMSTTTRPMTLRYVSPETTPRIPQLEDLQVDIQATAACLFEALVLRPATPGAKDPFADLDQEMRLRIPPPLAAIVRKAMANDIINGYQSILALRHDLAQFIAGLHPAAYDPGLSARFQAWIYRERKTLLLTCASLAVAAGLALVIRWQVGRYLQRWGDPIVSETFSDESWRERWFEAQPNAFETKNGKLVSKSPREAVLVYRQRLNTPVAIEYTGRILKGARPCDLSIWWSERAGALDDPAKVEDGARLFMIQAGAYENSFFAIHRRPDLQRVAYANRQLEIDKDYRFRVEIDGDTLSLAIDGERVLEYRELFPSTSGYIALYGYFPGKSFDDVHIYQKSLPRVVSPVATGDALYQFEHYAEAASLYARLAESDPDSEIGQQALYRKGLAERRLGRSEVSRETWASIKDQHLIEVTDCLRLEDLLDTWQIDLLLTRFDEQYRTRPQMQSELQLQWQHLLSKLRRDLRRDEAIVLRYLALRERLFPDDSSSAFQAGSALMDMGRYAEVLRQFPGERRLCATALLALGRTADVLKADWTLTVERNTALMMMGEFTQALASPNTDSYTRALLLCKMGLAENALRDTQEYYPSLIHLGRAEEMLTRPQFWNSANDAMLALGRYEEAAKRGGSGNLGSEGDYRASVMLGRLDEAERQIRRPIPWARLLAAAEAGNTEEMLRIRPKVRLPVNLSEAGGWFAGVVIGPFIDRMLGSKSALADSLAQAVQSYPGLFSKRAWFFSRAVLGQGDDNEVLGMPAATEALAWLTLARALRCELRDQPAEALATYRTFTELPRHLRLLDNNAPDPVIECFVAWHLRALAAPRP